MTHPIKLGIVDDQKLFLKGLKYIIQTFDSIDLMLEATNGEEFLEKIKTTPPDVVLLDLKMPIMDGIEVTKYLKVNYPKIKIILLSMYHDDMLITHLMELGADGYLLKDEEPKIVREAIEAVMVKGFYFNDYVSKALLKRVKSKEKMLETNSFFKFTVKLTPREVEVLRLICEENTTAEIAQKLFISTRTVEGHRKNLLEKTQVKNSIGLVIYAIKNKIVNVL